MAADSVGFANGVFCPPLPGKLGPFAEDGVSRIRVCQSAQKGGNCHYYALQILRGEDRIGNHPLVAPQLSARMKDGQLGESERIQFEQLVVDRTFVRECEVVASAYRKGKQKVDDHFDLAIHMAKFYEDLSAEQGNTRAAAKLILGACKKDGKPDPSGYRKMLIKELETFLGQDVHDNFLTCLRHQRYEARAKVNQKLFDCCKVPRESVENFGFKKWEDLSLNEKYVRESIVAFSCLQCIFRCKESSWNPSQGPEALIEQLRVYGPHVIGGLIGKRHYEDAPSVQPNLVQGRQIHYWKVGAKISPSTIGHIVVVVGAQIKNGKGFVYFLDPEDGSNPRDLKSQKVYVMSYDKLKEKITSLDGLRFKGAGDAWALLSDRTYAVHMGKKREPQS